MNSTVLESLFPVVLLIALGFAAGRRGWIGAAGAKDLSQLAFTVLSPPLLFRSMSTVHVEQLDFRPLASYFLAVAVIFAATLLAMGFNRRGAVLALANTFSNTVMIGIPLVQLAYGQEGLVILLTLISVHALVLLTLATILLEVAVLHEGAGGSRPVRRTVLLALRNALVHPVPLPIIAGLLFAQTGLVLPPLVDAPLKLLAAAFGPLALLLVGVTLAGTKIGASWRPALGLAVVKNVVHPLLVLAFAWLLGLNGLPLAVMMIAAALPIGANVFLFSQRYDVAQSLVTAAVAVSAVIAIVSLTVVLGVFA